VSVRKRQGQGQGQSIYYRAMSLPCHSLHYTTQTPHLCCHEKENQTPNTTPKTLTQETQDRRRKTRIQETPSPSRSCSLFESFNFTASICFAGSNH